MKLRPITGGRATALLFSFTALLGACVGPPPEAVTLGTPEVPRVALVGAGRTVSVARPKDARPDPAIVGKSLGGQYSKTIATNTEVAVWVGDAIVKSLEQAGYRIERTEIVNTAPNVVAIGVSITDAEAEFGTVGLRKTHGEARVVVKFQIYNSGRVVFARTFSGSSSTYAGDAESEQYSELLDKALSEMLRQAIPTLAAILSREGSKS
jgi:YajG family uncharacterized lipoprotein